MTAADRTGRRARLLHRLFTLVVAVKGLDGVVDLVGGAVLLLLPPGAIAAWADAVTRHELSEDPGDVLANLLHRWGSDFGRNAQLFVAAYLLLHGVTKLLLAASLLMGRRWAYPVALVFLAVFMVYAGYRLAFAWSWFLVAVIILDAATIALVAREWRTRRGSPLAAPCADSGK